MDSFDPTTIDPLKLVVKGVAWKSTHAHFRTLYGTYGATNIEVMRPQWKYTWIIIDFATAEGAAKAFQETNGVKFCDRKLFVQPYFIDGMARQAYEISIGRRESWYRLKRRREVAERRRQEREEEAGASGSQAVNNEATVTIPIEIDINELTRTMSLESKKGNTPGVAVPDIPGLNTRKKTGESSSIPPNVQPPSAQVPESVTEAQGDKKEDEKSEEMVAKTDEPEKQKEHQDATEKIEKPKQAYEVLDPSYIPTENSSEYMRRKHAQSCSLCQKLFKKA